MGSALDLADQRCRQRGSGTAANIFTYRVSNVRALLIQPTRELFYIFFS
jgi:hypothetical protein